MYFSKSIVLENLHKISGETKTFCIPVKVLLHSLQCERKKREEQNIMMIPAMLMHIQIQISNTFTEKRKKKQKKERKNKAQTND